MFVLGSGELVFGVLDRIVADLGVTIPAAGVILAVSPPRSPGRPPSWSRR
jgi:predicted MFS family arabinose efflux permease